MLRPRSILGMAFTERFELSDLATRSKDRKPTNAPSQSRKALMDEHLLQDMPLQEAKPLAHEPALPHTASRHPRTVYVDDLRGDEIRTRDSQLLEKLLFSQSIIAVSNKTRHDPTRSISYSRTQLPIFAQGSYSVQARQSGCAQLATSRFLPTQQLSLSLSPPKFSR